MDMMIYICRLCLKSFRSQGWAARHEEGCFGMIQMGMLDGPQVRPEHLRSQIDLGVLADDMSRIMDKDKPEVR